MDALATILSTAGFTEKPHSGLALGRSFAGEKIGDWVLSAYFSSRPTWQLDVSLHHNTDDRTRATTSPATCSRESLGPEGEILERSRREQGPLILPHRLDRGGAFRILGRVPSWIIGSYLPSR